MIALKTGAALALIIACVDARAIQKPFSTLEVGLFSGVFPAYPAGTGTAIGTAPAATSDINTPNPTDGGGPVISTAVDIPVMNTPSPTDAANPAITSAVEVPSASPVPVAGSNATMTTAADLPPVNTPPASPADAAPTSPGESTPPVAPAPGTPSTPAAVIAPPASTQAGVFPSQPDGASAPIGTGNAFGTGYMPADPIISSGTAMVNVAVPQQTNSSIGDSAQNTAPAGVFISVPFQTVTVTITAAPQCAPPQQPTDTAPATPAGDSGPGATSAGSLDATPLPMPAQTPSADPSMGTALGPMSSDMAAPFANATSIDPSTPPMGTGTPPDTPTMSPPEVPSIPTPSPPDMSASQPSATPEPGVPLVSSPAAPDAQPTPTPESGAPLVSSPGAPDAQPTPTPDSGVPLVSSPAAPDASTPTVPDTPPTGTADSQPISTPASPDEPPVSTPVDPGSPSMGTGLPTGAPYPAGPYSNGTVPTPTAAQPLTPIGGSGPMETLTDYAYVPVTTTELEPVSTLTVV